MNQRFKICSQNHLFKRLFFLSVLHSKIKADVDTSMIVRVVIKVRSNLLFQFTEHIFPTVFTLLFQSGVIASRPSSTLV